jgi:hypothetical protein
MKQRLMKYVWLATFILAPSLTVIAQSGFDAEPHRQQLEEIHEWMRVNSAALFTFWDKKAAVDYAADGFYGDINQHGIVSKGQRNSIQHGRQLFTVSTWHRLGEHSDSDGNWRRLHHVTFSAPGLSSGIYIYRLTAGVEVIT